MNDHSRGCQGREYVCSCGYNDYTESEYERTKKLLAVSLAQGRQFKDALVRIKGNGNATGCNPQIMVDIAKSALLGETE